MSDRQDGLSRRGFLKTTAVGALAFSAAPMFLSTRTAAAYEPGGKIHPNIDPLRVVGVQDSAMTTGQSVDTAWSVRDPLVAADVVSENMDRMAMKLTGDKRAADAWKAVFIKPAGKEWGDVVVAIKTNQIAQQHTRSAVMAKVCNVLVDEIGVKPGNIHVYDAKHGGSMPRNPWTGLPEGIRLESQWGGIDTSVPVPGPWRDGSGSSECNGHLARGAVDILTNIALSKGHGAQFGNFTMSMKNHFGTFNPRFGHSGDGAGYLIAINKSPQILGQIDEKTGNVVFPRQQLTIIDALWASEGGPGGLPNVQPNMLIMGTCNPVVDYVVARDLRQERMGWRVNQQVCDRFLEGFGIAAQDLPNSGMIIDALA